MRKLSIILAVLLHVSLVSAQESMPFKDPGLSIETRVQDLISRLSLQEKSEQMMHNAPGIDRLGIKPYSWWNEALHGVARTGRATVFPQSIGLAATFDENLMRKIGEAISDEAWAKYNISQRLENYTQYSGITFYSPNVNIFRDPRWGRGQETYGEDPYLTSRLGVAFVKGMQGNDPKFLKTAACAKHFVVHSGPEEFRHSFNAEPPMKDFGETYTPAFEALVKEGQVESVMCAYNRTFGEPCCGSDFLMNQILRDSWNFKGYITSDCWAIRNFNKFHGTTQTLEESAALAVKTGVNLCCGNEYEVLPKAVADGLVSENAVDSALSILLRTRFKLGLFDPINKNPYTQIPESVIGCQKHVDLAREAADKSIVLLQNRNQILPLKKDLKSLYLVGPYAANQDILLGNYNGISDRLTTIVEAVAGRVSVGTSINYRQGVEPSVENINPMNYALGDANAEVIVACFGVSGVFEGEEGEATASSHKGDRMDLNLPANQLDFLRKLRAATRKSIVLVLTGGSPICTEELKDLADAILFVWYPGQEGGLAVADVIFGDVNPSGRLPITFPKSVSQLPDFMNYSMEGRTYRYMTSEPLYPFGFGLSYTRFNYSGMTLSSETLKKGQSLTASVELSNTGDKAGEEVVQLYITDLKASTRTPLSSLKGIKRILLQPGESQKVEFDIDSSMLELVNENGDRILEKGEFKIWIGGSSPVEVAQSLGAAPLQSKLIKLK